uniref:Band 7 domain-containing protein n=1 Tax=Gadus morhua TaxID=8049 RepID=A0A8C5C0M5_GADMO
MFCNTFCGLKSQSQAVSDVFATMLTTVSVFFILVTFPFTAWICIKVVQEYERAVIFRLGRVVKGQAKGPGVFWIIPWLDVIRKVDMRTVHYDMPPQEVLVMDWVPLTVDAVLFYRVKRVLDGTLATHTLALTPVETPGSELVCHRALDVSLQSDLGVYSFTLGVRRTPV